MMILYTVELVGGPYDGAPGLGWADDGAHEPPDAIHVGRCPGGGVCGHPGCGRRRHVSYWVEGLEEVPTQTVEYQREDAFVTDALSEPAAGVARYVCGALDLFGRLEERELVPAGIAARYERVAAAWAAYVGELEEWLGREHPRIGGCDGRER